MGDQLTGGAVLMCLHHRVPELLAALVDEAATTTQQADIPDIPEPEPDLPVPVP